MLLSAFSSSFPSGSTFSNPFSSSFNGGLPSWNFSESKPPVITSSSGSDGSAEANQPGHAKTRPGSNRNHLPTAVMDERKRRRMISNRESARRSRMRKQKQLENFRTHLTRLRMENRELSNRLRFFHDHSDRVRTENDQLRSEFTTLRQTLSDITQLLLFQQQLQPFMSGWPCNIYNDMI